MADHSPRTWPYVAVGVVGAVVGTTLLIWRGASAWMAPFAGLIIAVSAVALPMAAVNGLVALFIADEDWQPEVKRAGVVTGLCSLIPLVAGVAWFSPTVRTTVLSKLSEQTRRTAAVGALEDPSVTVAAEGCRHLVELSPDLERQTLLDVLDRRQDVAINCLNRSYQGEGAQQRAESYAGVLTKRWQESAYESSDHSRACQRIKMGARLPTSGSVGVPALLTCALDGPREQLKQCCAESLREEAGTGSDLVDAFGDSLDSEVGRRLLGPFLTASLHQHQMNEQEREIAETLGLVSPPVRKFAIRLACTSLESEAVEDIVVRQMRAWISDEACVGSDAYLSSDGVGGLAKICGEVTGELEGATEPREALCQVADRQRTSSAVEKASGLVDAAVGGGVHQKWKAAIEQGYASSRSASALKGRMAEFVQEGRTRGGMRPSVMAERLSGLKKVANKGSAKELMRQEMKKMTKVMKQMEESLGKHDMAKKLRQLDGMTEEEVVVPEAIDSKEKQEKLRKQYKKQRKRLEEEGGF